MHLVGSAQGLSAGASVRMQGIYVGDVTDVHMEYDAKTRQLNIPVTLELEPQRVRIVNSDLHATGFDARAYAAFDAFVARGLRARLASGNMLTGQKIVSLDFLPNLPKAALITGGLYPEIPAAESSDVDTVLQSADDLLKSLKVASQSLNGLITSPALKRSLVSLDTTLHDASIHTGPLLANLRAVTKSADATLRQATSTLAVTGAAVGSEDNGGDLAGTLRAFKESARSLRALTDYLENHPEALIQGKPARGDK